MIKIGDRVIGKGNKVIDETNLLGRRGVITEIGDSIYPGEVYPNVKVKWDEPWNRNGISCAENRIWFSLKWCKLEVISSSEDEERVRREEYAEKYL